MAPAGKEIIIRHGSRMANRMLQYLAAKALQRRFSGYAITGYSIPEWGLEGPAPLPGKRGVPKIEIQRFDTDLVTGLIADGALDRLMLKSVCGNYSALPDRDFASSLFDGSRFEAQKTTARDIVIHIRLGDTLIPGRHSDYGPLSLAFYERVIAEAGKHPIFIGELGEDFYSAALRKRFRGATFLQGGSVLHDFETMRRARHLIIATSTFSWMAAWLSHAEAIHYPLSGILNPEQAPGIDMLPLGDRRYRFYRFPVRSWKASEEQFADLLAPALIPELRGAKIRALHARSAAAWEPELARWRDQFMASVGAASGGRLIAAE